MQQFIVRNSCSFSLYLSSHNTEATLGKKYTYYSDETQGTCHKLHE